MFLCSFVTIQLRLTLNFSCIQILTKSYCKFQSTEEVFADMSKTVFEFQNEFFFHLNLTVPLINIHKCSHIGTFKVALKARDRSKKTS